jgi:hypothetical protein
MAPLTDRELSPQVKDPLFGCDVGHHQDAQTKQVHAHQVKGGGTVLCDTPGFDDTDDSKGSTTDVANSIATFHTIRACRSVQILLLVDTRDIGGGRGGDLKKLLQLMNRFVTDDFLDSVLVGFTHWPDKNLKKLKSELKELSQAKHIKADASLIKFMKHMLKLLSKHKEALILHPAQDDKQMLMEILDKEVERIQEPAKVLNSPLSAQSQLELLAGCQALELDVKDQLGQNTLTAPALAEAVEIIDTLSLALGMEDVTSIRSACADAIFEYCIRVIEQANAALDIKTVALARQQFDILYGFQSFVAFLGDKGLELKNRRQKLIKKVNIMVKVLATIDENVEQGFPDYDSMLLNLDVLQTICSEGPCSLLPYLVNDAGNLYSSSIKKVRALGLLQYELAIEMIEKAQLDSNLSALFDSLAQCQTVTRHTGCNSHFEDANAAFNRHLVHRINCVKATLVGLSADGVANVAADESMRKNSVPEKKIFEVLQLAPGKPRKVQLQVRKIGLTVLDGSKRLHSYAYKTISSFDATPCADGVEGLTVVAGKKKLKLQFQTVESDAIADFMLQYKNAVSEANVSNDPKVVQPTSVAKGQAIAMIWKEEVGAVKDNLRVLHLAIEALPGNTAPETTQLHSNCMQQIELLTNELFASIDKNLCEPENFLKISVTLYNIVLLGGLTDGDGTMVRRQQKCDDIEQRLHAIITDTKSRMSSQELRDLDCTFICAKLDALRNARDHLQSTLSHELMSTLNAQYDLVTGNLDARYTQMTVALADNRNKDATAAFYQLRQMENMHSAQLDRHVMSMPAAIEKSLRELQTYVESLRASCLLSSTTTGLPSAESAEHHLNLLKTYAGLFLSATGTTMDTAAGFIDAWLAGEPAGTTVDTGSTISPPQPPALPCLCAVACNFMVDFGAIAKKLHDGYGQCTYELAAMSNKLQLNHKTLLAECKYKDAMAISDELKYRCMLDGHLADDAAEGGMSFESSWKATVCAMKDLVKRSEDSVRFALRADDMETAKSGIAEIETMVLLRTCVEAVDDVLDRLQSDFTDKRGSFLTKVNDLLTNEDYEQLAKTMVGHASLTSNAEMMDYAEARDLVTKRMKQQFEKAVHILELMRGQRRVESLGKLSSLFSTFEKIECLGHEAVLGGRVAEWRKVLFDKMVQQNRQIAARGENQLIQYKFCGCLTYREELESFTAHFPAAVAENARQEADQLSEKFEQKAESLTQDIDTAVRSNDFLTLDKILDGLREAEGFEAVTLANVIDGQFIKQVTYVGTQLHNRAASIKCAIDGGQIREVKTALIGMDRVMKSRHAQDLVPGDLLMDLKSEYVELTGFLFTERGLLDQNTAKVQDALRQFKEIDNRNFSKHKYSFVDSLKTQYAGLKDATVSPQHLLAQYEQGTRQLSKFEQVLSPVVDTRELTDIRLGLYIALGHATEDGIKRAEVSIRQNKYDIAEEMFSFVKTALPIFVTCDNQAQNEVLAKYWENIGKQLNDKANVFLAKVDAIGDTFKKKKSVLDLLDLNDPTTVDTAELSKLLTMLKKNGTYFEGGLSLDMDENMSYETACDTLKEKLRIHADIITGCVRRSDVNEQLIANLESCVKLCSVKDTAISDHAKQITVAQSRVLKNALDGRMAALVAQYKLAIKESSRLTHGQPGNSATLQQINREMEMLRDAEARLAQVLPSVFSVSDKMVKQINAETVGRKDAFLAMLGQKGVTLEYHQVVDCLLGLYKVPSEISEQAVKACVKQCIDDILDFCYKRAKKASGGFDFMTLANHLSRDPLGAEIVEDSRQFKAFKMAAFKDCTARITGKDALAKMQATNSLSDEQVVCLDAAYAMFESEYDNAIKGRHFYSRDTRALAAEFAREPNLPKLIAGIFAVWSLDSCQDTESGPQMFTPHPCQVLTLLSLLRVDQKDTLVGRFKSLFTNEELAKMIDSSHLIQLKTGEGKSVILGVLATLLAVRGCDVDCVCYSQYLSERDFTDFLPVFEAFNITQNVWYGTFKGLSEKKINERGDVRDLTAAFVRGKSGPRKNLRSSQRPAILLIDEVDVFFSRDFYGETYKPDAHYCTDEVAAIQRFIWEQRALPLEQLRAAVKGHAAFAALLQGRTELTEFFNQHVTLMTKDVKDVDRHAAEYQIIDGQLRYKSQEQMTATLHVGYKTLFSYFKESGNGKVPAENLEKELGLQIPCGNFSFAEIPKQYAQILGVTGTLDSLGNFEQAIVQTDYKIKLQTFAPSIYGDSQLNFKEKDDVHVERGKVDFYRRVLEESLEMGKQKRATLIFFESEQALKEFKESEYGAKIPNLQSVTTATQNVEHHLKAATRAGSTTLFSAVHGRGLDFKCFDPNIQAAGGVHVVQTFLSEAVSEEIQIKGRTARQGKKGTFKMILHAADLIDKFSVTQASTLLYVSHTTRHTTPR